jgi:hypothetical protein
MDGTAGVGLPRACRSVPQKGRAAGRRRDVSGSITRKLNSGAESQYPESPPGANSLVMVVPEGAAPSERSVHRSSLVGGKEPCHVD